MHACEQPSPSWVLPSSHCSLPSIIPLPQLAGMPPSPIPSSSPVLPAPWPQPPRVNSENSASTRDRFMRGRAATPLQVAGNRTGTRVAISDGVRRYRGVLLDVDGTLVDSVAADTLSKHQAFAGGGRGGRRGAGGRRGGGGGGRRGGRRAGGRK